MPAKPGLKPPKYSLHQASGKARAVFVDSVSGRRQAVWLGEYGSHESREKFARLVWQWEARGRRLKPRSQPKPDEDEVRSVAEMTRAYRDYKRPLISKSQYRAIALALDLLDANAGDLPAGELGPRRVKGVREAMVARDWGRSTVNRSIRYIVNAAKWAVSEEMIAPDVHLRLDAIPNLRAGEMGVKDGDPIRPVSQAAIQAVRPFLSSVVNTMIDLQLVTGMRPGEICTMRPLDIDMSEAIWSYRPAQHKTKNRGKGREVPLGPRAIALVSPYLEGAKLDAPLFSPRASNAERKAQGAAGRRRENQPETPRATCRRIGVAYKPDSYRRAIHRACEKAGIDSWSPHQLRHTAATAMRAEHGLETASLLLGHSNAKVTAEHYAEADREKLLKAVARTG